MNEQETLDMFAAHVISGMISAFGYTVNNDFEYITKQAYEIAEKIMNTRKQLKQ